MTKASEQRPELLAPVGSFETLETALNWGADAVYFGCGKLNARSERVAFEVADLSEVVELCSQAYVRPYLTLNTIIYEAEIKSALQLAEQAERAGIQALIVQDYGLAAELVRLFPGLEIHASTQMTVGSPAALERAAAAGFKRVILPRESSLTDLCYLAGQADKLGIETEVFVQGALCVSVSGQCHLSRLRGGRSANRGACACPCRQTWQLTDEFGGIFKTEPLLSPKDQCNLAYLKKLVEAGVHSFKIEGRLRRPSYIAAALTAYRKVLAGVEPAAADRQNLLQAFNRGGAFTDAFIGDRDGRNFLSGACVGHLGLPVGLVKNSKPDSGQLQIRLVDQGLVPANGDLVAVRRGPNKAEVARAPAAKVAHSGSNLILQGFHPRVLATIQPGDYVYRLTEAAYEHQVARKRKADRPIVITVSQDRSGVVHFTAALKDKPELAVVCEQRGGRTGEIRDGDRGEEVEPIYAELPRDRIIQQLKKAGGSGFAVTAVQLEGPISLKIKVAELNQIRRDLLTDLQQRLDETARAARAAGRSLEAKRKLGARSKVEAVKSPARQKLRVADQGKIRGRIRVSLPVYQPGQALYTDPAIRLALPVQSLLAMAPAAIEKLAEQVGALEAILPVEANVAEWQSYQKFLNSSWAVSVLAGVLTGQAVLQDSFSLPIFGDSGLNVVNQEAVKILRCDLTGVLLSPELTVRETRELIDRLGGTGLEVWLYGKEPAMYMKHCPVGLRQSGCRLCRDRRYRLTDDSGRSYRLTCLPERGCRTALWADRPTNRIGEQSLFGGEDLIYRLNFVDEGIEEQTAVVKSVLQNIS